MNKDIVTFLYAWVASLVICIAIIFYYFSNKVGGFYIINKYNFYDLINRTLGIFVSALISNSISFTIVRIFKSDYGIDFASIGLILILPIIYISPLLGYINTGFYEFFKFIIQSNSYFEKLAIVFTILVVFGSISRRYNIEFFSSKSKDASDV